MSESPEWTCEVVYHHPVLKHNFCTKILIGLHLLGEVSLIWTLFEFGAWADSRLGYISKCEKL